MGNTALPLHFSTEYLLFSLEGRDCKKSDSYGFFFDFFEDILSGE